ncbi:hypothetical protein N0V88_000912 [Collariella sp. IMI 366227]|nr:hypothetical protein N0V88_000912 [Collariella sp. IMI 366227]
MADSQELIRGCQGIGDDSLVAAEMKMALKEGLQLTKDGQSSKALAIIMKAINLCPCHASDGKARHGKDKSCHISQCITAVQGKERSALYQVAGRPCACGYSWPSCPRQLHALALDALADCLAKADQFVSAFSTGLSIVRLDPVSPVGYCRVAKILHLLIKQAKGPESVAQHAVAVIFRDANLSPTRLEHLLVQFVKTGLHNTQRYRRGPNDTYHVVLQQMAHSLRIKDARRDPVNTVPPEVFTLIFSFLNVPSLLKCLHVSKQWKKAILEDAMLWTDLRLVRPKNPGRFLASFLQQRQSIKTFAIYDTTSFSWTSNKFQSIIYGLPRLQQLCLGAGGSFGAGNPANFFIGGRRGPKLRRLALSSFNARLVANLVRLASGTLEDLTLDSLNGSLDVVFETVRLPKLKKLQLFGDPVALTSPWSLLQMEPVVAATPNLEQLRMDNLIVSWAQQAALTSAAEKKHLWPNLTKIILGAHLDAATFIGPNHEPIGTWRAFPPLPKSLRSVEIFQAERQTAENLLLVADWEDENDVQAAAKKIKPQSLPNLETFRCRAPIETRYLQDIFGQAAESGSLRALELTAEDTWHDGSFKPAQDLAFANSENLHTLGLCELNVFDPFDRYGTTGEFDGQALLDWIDCFPNLHTVSAYTSAAARGFASLIQKLILHSKIKAIHQDILRGAEWDQCVALAKKHGVTLHHTPKSMPPAYAIVEDI